MDAHVESGGRPLWRKRRSLTNVKALPSCVRVFVSECVCVCVCVRVLRHQNKADSRPSAALRLVARARTLRRCMRVNASTKQTQYQQVRHEEMV